MWGCTRETARASGYTGAMRDLPLETAKAIAKKRYWDAVQGDQLPAAVALQLFDIQYNGGHAAQWLQKAVGVPVDGAIGAITIGRVRSLPQLPIIMSLLAYRAEYYAAIRNPAMINGWVNRLAMCLREGAKSNG